MMIQRIRCRKDGERELLQYGGAYGFKIGGVVPILLVKVINITHFPTFST